MADPTIQTFCCHHANGTDMAVTIMEEFNTDAYNAVCLFSSCLGILGAIYQILPRQEFANKHRWLSFSAARGRKIIVWLAVADLLASLGVFTRSTIWINYKNIMPAVEDDSSVVFCAISSALIQYFYTATWIWTLIYAIDMRLILSEKASKTLYYHLVAWILPAVLTTVGLSLLYLPDANCHTASSLNAAILRILPNYIATYVPVATVMIANPYLYHHSSKDMEEIITSASGQFTSREREILDAIKIKFSVINFVFYLCWVPNLLNGILLWTLWFHLPAEWIIAIWYIMALMNPLQALFNCMVYRRWRNGSEKIILPWRKVEGSFPTARSPQSRESFTSSVREEILPLLQTAQSVNGYRNYW
ncbi:G-protein coupled receptor 143-like isoform X2 [Tribolium madens]|uniref:G-protein coupled receptor 143-like isoform X2 n=1 Tax=Tribolium madens TaxID=41895 RepID=UPI001CF726A6|nr:G-protein coupled receptor 143-like isoform X2 [Tribolium madens]